MVSPGVFTSTPPGTGTPHDALIRRLTIGFCLMALVLGALQAWMARLDMNPDGIQYLDNAAAYRHLDFRNALNTQWSPLYPWLIGALNAVFHPTREQEFPLVHLLNFLIYAMSLGAFLFLTRSMRRLLPDSSAAGFLLLGYSAFLYCSLAFTGLGFVTPDVLVSFFAFAAAGLLVQMAAGDRRASLFVALGVAVGIGYLAKAPFLPIGLACLAIAAVLGRKRVILACAVFVAIVAPYVWALSHAAGRFTFGDSARLNIAWHVNELPNTNWQGGPTANGRPAHPTRQLSGRPAIFEFATPIAATYPPWYDPAYWNQGVQIAWRPQQFARAALEQIRLYAYWLHHGQIALVFALLALFFLCHGKRQLVDRFKLLWPVLALGALPFVLYAPVHAESRYLAPFFVLLWAALFFLVLDDPRISLAIASTAALLMCMEAIGAAFTPTIPDQPPARVFYQVAHELKTLGLQPGDRVAVADLKDLPDYWAYLAGARVGVEISFSSSSRERQSEWTTARGILASQAATFLVAPATDGITDQPGWRELGATKVFAYPLHPSGAY